MPGEGGADRSPCLVGECRIAFATSISFFSQAAAYQNHTPRWVPLRGRRERLRKKRGQNGNLTV